MGISDILGKSIEQNIEGLKSRMNVIKLSHEASNKLEQKYLNRFEGDLIELEKSQIRENSSNRSSLINKFEKEIKELQRETSTVIQPNQIDTSFNQGENINGKSKFFNIPFVKFSVRIVIPVIVGIFILSLIDLPDNGDLLDDKGQITIIVISLIFFGISAYQIYSFSKRCPSCLIWNAETQLDKILVNQRDYFKTKYITQNNIQRKELVPVTENTFQINSVCKYCGYEYSYLTSDTVEN